MKESQKQDWIRENASEDGGSYVELIRITPSGVIQIFAPQYARYFASLRRRSLKSKGSPALHLPTFQFEIRHFWNTFSGAKQFPQKTLKILDFGILLFWMLFEENV